MACRETIPPLLNFTLLKQEKMHFNLFLDLKCWRFGEISYLCARFRFSKTDNFFLKRTGKVFQNGQLPLIKET